MRRKLPLPFNCSSRASYPRAGIFGGGGFLVYRDQAGEVATLDFRESGRRDMYSENSLNIRSQLKYNRGIGCRGSGDLCRLTENL